MGEPGSAMDRTEAAALTGRIREEAGRTWALLVEAHDNGAWSALGYAGWDDYVTTEFDQAAGPAHRLLDRARVGLPAPGEDDPGSELELSESEALGLVNQVVLSLEALTMGLDLVDLSSLGHDAQAAGVVDEAITTFSRLRAALLPATGQGGPAPGQ